MRPRFGVRLIRSAALRLAAVMAAGALVLSGTPVPAGAAVSHAQITGDGSSWAANAVNQWISDVQQDGLQVVFTPVGSAQGRQDFANKIVDFAVSDIGYQGIDKSTGQSDTSQGRPYAYLPVVAGGTAFPYHIEVGGQLVRNLRLSGETLAKIFTNQITTWSDPEITADNNGRQLPAIPIIPVVHSEGAGTTAQFTTWLAEGYPQMWSQYAGYPSFTEYWPRQGSQIAENGSDGVMNFVSSSAGNGAIGVDEYSYALQQGYPVIDMENAAGYFVPPTQYDVAVALTQAQINEDKSSANYLLQNLSNVYTYNDPRTYPLSSYSYGIIPTSSTDGRMTTPKRQTLADWLSYSVCQGQAEMGPIGYSPLPVNLVQASFQQIQLLQQADPGVQLQSDNVADCHNPTFEANSPNTNYLAQVAPEPPACAKAGAGPCGAGADVFNGNPQGGKATTVSKTTSGSGSAQTSTGGSAGSSSASGTGGGSASPSPSAGSRVKSGSSAAAASSGAASSGQGPSAGRVAPGGGTGPGGSATAGNAPFQAVSVPETLSADRVGGDAVEVLAVLALGLLLVGPPYFMRLRARHKGDA